jgi:hypothetical protein
VTASSSAPTDQLKESRKLIVSLSVISGAIGMLPLPLASDLFIDVTRGVLLRRLARRRGLELSPEDALRIVGTKGLSVPRLAVASVLAVAARLVWRRLSRTLLFLLRFDDMGRTYFLGTCFDYYCAAHHRGQSLDRPLAEALGRAISVASQEAGPQMVAAAFGRVLGELAQMGATVPQKIWSRISFAVVDDAVRQAEAAEDDDASGLMARAAREIEHEISSTLAVSLEALYRAFDAAWVREAQLSAAQLPAPEPTTSGEPGRPATPDNP